MMLRTGNDSGNGARVTGRGELIPYPATEGSPEQSLGISRIPNSSFTLVEVMVSACILALGTVFIYQAFFTNLASFGYCLNSIELSNWMDEKLWEAHDSLRRYGSLGATETQGVLVKGNKRFNWNLAVEQIDEAEDSYALFSIDMEVFWNEGRQRAALSRNSYALVKKQ